MSCDCCPCWKARNRARIAVNDLRHPQPIPVTSEGVSWGCLLSGSSGNAGPVSYVMARQGAYSSPLTPPRRKERPKVSATGAHDSSSCVLKCSLDKSRPASPARLRLRLHAGLRARGRRGPKNLRHTTGKIEPARTHKPRQNLQAEPVMSCDCCPCWKARNRARIAVNDLETPQPIPRNK